MVNLKNNPSFNEIGLLPNPISDITSRSLVDPYYIDEDGNKRLPIFVAPMTCLLDNSNFQKFVDSCFIPIFPVWHNQKNKLEETTWTAYSLNTAKIYVKNNYFEKCKYVLIDCANGHMRELYELVKVMKQKFPHLKVMVGNIANPITYFYCCVAGVDYVRVSIGGGFGCTTSLQTGIHASMPYLIATINDIRKNLKSGKYAYICDNYITNKIDIPLDDIFNIKTFTKVVADGGLSTISDCVKALALGADYVMLGHQFARCKEACCKTIKTSNNGFPIVSYYGQSSNLGQLDRFGEIQSSSEGCERLLEANTCLNAFQLEFERGLRSCMSYTDSGSLKDFIGNVDYNIISNLAYSQYSNNKWIE